MSNQQPEYSRIYMRIRRADDTQKEDIRNLIQELLTLEYETEHYLNILTAREKINHPIKVNPNYKLETHTPYPIKSLISEHGIITETYNVIVGDQKQEFLIPFYKNIATEYFNSHKQIGLFNIETKIKSLQSLTINELKDKKKIAKSLREKCIFYRIDQEATCAREVFPNNIYEKYDEDEFEDTQKQKDVWVSLMHKLCSEGYGFFEAKIACSKIMNLLSLHKPITTATDDAILRDEIDFPYVDLSNYPKLETWSNNEKHATIMKESIYIQERKKELELIRQEENRLRYINTMLEIYFEQCLPKEQVSIECFKNGLNKQEIGYALNKYEEMLNSIPLKAKPKHPVSFEIYGETQGELQRDWLKCMAIKSGGAANRHAYPQNFDESVQQCSYTVFQKSGLQPTPKSWEKAKQFFSVGYWQTHSLSDYLKTGDEQND